MILLPSAGGTVNAPPLITLPTDDVVMFRVWQVAHPTALNRFDPVIASPVAASAVSRGGAFVARMKAANSSMSLSGSSPHEMAALLAHGWLSGTWSKFATDRPIDVFSVRSSRLVIPISFR